MYGSTGGPGAGGAAGVAGATGLTQLPDTGGPGAAMLALLTPDGFLGWLFLILAAWAILACGLAVLRIIPREES